MLRETAAPTHRGEQHSHDEIIPVLSADVFGSIAGFVSSGTKNSGKCGRGFCAQFQWYKMESLNGNVSLHLTCLQALFAF